MWVLIHEYPTVFRMQHVQHTHTLGLLGHFPDFRWILVKSVSISTWYLLSVYLYGSSVMAFNPGFEDWHGFSPEHEQMSTLKRDHFNRKCSFEPTIVFQGGYVTSSFGVIRWTVCKSTVLSRHEFRSVYWMKLDFNAENSGDFCFGSGLNNGRVVINDPDIISP